MDLMADDLRNVMLNCNQAFDEVTARSLFYQMVNAVNYCHDRNILHGDLKLENFFLNFEVDYKKITVKLGDFGIA